MGGLAPLQSRVKSFAEDTRAVFRETPHLKTLLLANLLSSFNSGLLIPVLPLFLISRGFSFLQLGVLYSLVAVSTIGVQLLSGRYHRFFGRRSVVVVLLFVSVVLFPLYLFVQTPLQFLLLNAASSFASAAAGPGLQVVLAELAAPRRRATLFAYLGTASSFSYALALITGGALLSVGYVAVFYVGTVLSFLSFGIMASFLLVDRSRQQAHRVQVEALTDEERAFYATSRTLAGEARAWRMSLRRAHMDLEGQTPTPRQAVRNVRWASIYLFLFGTSLAIYPVYFPIYLRQQGLPVEWLGLVIASSWITYGLCQPIGGRWADRTGKHRELIVVSLLCAAALNLVMATASLWWIVAAWVLIGIADGLGRPVTSALIVESVTRAGRGSAFGWTSAADTLARIVAPYALAFAIQGHGIGHGLFIVTFLIAGAAIPPYFIRKLPQPEAPPQPEVPVPQGGAA